MTPNNVHRPPGLAKALAGMAFLAAAAAAATAMISSTWIAPHIGTETPRTVVQAH